MKRIVYSLLAGAALASMLILQGCGASDAARDGDPAPAALIGPSDVAEAARADLIAGVPVSGTLEPAVDVKITAPFPEVIERVLVKEGQSVRAGAVLARFRDSALAPAAASAEAQYRVAAADHVRMKNLLAEGAISQRELESAEAALRAAEASWAQARKRLDEATVRAPVDGVIAQRSVQSGDRVADGDPLFRLVNTAELDFEATVPSERVGAVRVGSEVALTLAGFPAGAIAGRVARVNATADPATRQVKVYVSVPNRDHRLVGDLFASGWVIAQRAAQVVAIPSAGVRRDSAGTFVWVIENGKAVRRTVGIGISDRVKDLVEIVSGVRAGERAIVGPIEGLAPGQAVKVQGGES